MENLVLSRQSKLICGENIYVVPRLIYGLEVHNLRKKDILQLEAFQRRCLKQLQSMPSRTDTVSLALLGMLPINVCIEKNILSLFGRIARDQSCIENDLAKRQLAVRDPSDKSWFSSVRNILNTYWLPTAYEILEHPPPHPSSEQWKKQVKCQLHSHVEQQWRDDITSKSTLKYLKKKGKRKVQGVPQSQTAALPRPQEEEETDKSKQAQTEQTY